MSDSAPVAKHGMGLFGATMVGTGAIVVNAVIAAITALSFAGVL